MMHGRKVAFRDIGKEHEEEIGLLNSDHLSQYRLPTTQQRRWHIWCIYLVVCLQSLAIFILLRWPLVYLDPTLAIWCESTKRLVSTHDFVRIQFNRVTELV